MAKQFLVLCNVVVDSEVAPDLSVKLAVVLTQNSRALKFVHWSFC